jgi:serine O-acetyltransferase
MIKTRNDLKEYLIADGKNYWHLHVGCIKRWYTHLFTDPMTDQTKIWSYIYNLRHLEYHINNKGLYHTLAKVYYSWRLRSLSYKTGFQISPNTCGKGLTIWHWGTILINGRVRIGENCTLRPMVLIGHRSAGEETINIGNNVTISSGVSIIGPLTIGNNVIIAPNAAVASDVPSNSLVGGVPAKVIKKYKEI